MGKVIDLKKPKSRETWCYADHGLDLKEKRPGFMSAACKKADVYVTSRETWCYAAKFDLDGKRQDPVNKKQIKSRETWCYAGHMP